MLKSSKKLEFFQLYLSCFYPFFFTIIALFSWKEWLKIFSLNKLNDYEEHYCI
ncbi:hypothetical protein C2G38_2063549 [Gigaspora rosea]|uniref:Uncharacterized protein n=1 Tax=Gigaspora rosea TaxID=44941 RepID=A0A397VYP4_9GLOM|nr:hypothetical protein C2G38_2063549 [Gigaspora rosea]